MQSLVTAVVAAIRESLEQLPSSQQDGVAGYAIVVDSDMVSAGGVSMTRAFAADPGNEWALFMPVDWPVEHVCRGFQDASKFLAQVRGDSYEARAAAVVHSLVEALEVARDTEGPLSDAVLLVICADGGGVWNDLESDAVRRLNSPHVHEQWLKWMGGAAR